MGMHLFDDSRSPAYIYTKESYIPEDFELIKNVNSHFNLHLAGKLNSWKNPSWQNRLMWTVWRGTALPHFSIK